jgi:hypothetical protein
MAESTQHVRDGEVNKREETHRLPRRCRILHDYILRWWVQSNVGKPRMPLCGHLRGIVFVLREEVLDLQLSQIMLRELVED